MGGIEGALDKMVTADPNFGKASSLAVVFSSIYFLECLFV